MEKRPAESHRRKMPATDIGHQMPGNLKFAIIVAVAIFWAKVLQSILSDILLKITLAGPILANFITAVVATLLGYFVLVSYRKIQARIKKIKV